MKSSRVLSSGFKSDASYKMGDKYKSVRVMYGKKLAMSRKYTLIQEIVIDPQDLFKLAPEYKDKFSKFDDTGLPTHMADGTELTKSAKKKLEKDRAKHAKKFAKNSK